MKIRKRFLVPFLMLVLLLSFSGLSSAHMTKQYPYIFWGESAGWSIDEDYHTNGTNLYYKFDTSDTNLTATYKQYVIDGAARWHGTISISQSANAVGTVHTGNYPSESFIAVFYDYEANSSGHLTSWKIMMNRAYASYLSATTLAHEFGHAVGLNDLYVFGNRSKLMYGYGDCTATAPTASDIKGAKVIAGNHVSHPSWAYKYYNTSSGINQHCRACTTCDGWKVGDVQSCTYNLPDIRCVQCGTPQGTIPN